jgi:hypothetical protein
LSENDDSLHYKINLIFEDNFQIEALSKINNFIHFFIIFKNVKPFMLNLHQNVIETLDMNLDSLDDFNEFLVKNALMQFIQEYLDYAQINQKRQVLKFLSDSLDKLQM